MARSVTLLNLRTWARQLASVESDPNITDTELTALANRHITEVYDLLIDAGPPDYYVAATTITTVIGTTAYAVPANFRSMLDVYVAESATTVRAVQPMRPGDRGRYRAPLSVQSVTLEYIPTPTLLAADGDLFDGVSGWEELVANLMARDVMIKQEADASNVKENIARLTARIAMRSRNRDRGHPRYTADLDDQSPIMPYASLISAYRLRGGNLELYEPAGTGV